MADKSKYPNDSLFPRVACVIVLFCALLGAVPASAAGRVECNSIRSAVLGQAVRYCALLPPSNDADKARRYPILYYLHGLGDNEQSLINLGGWNLTENLREAGKIGEFLILAPDGGRSFYINSRDGQVRYEDFFIREFVPAMEKKFRANGDKPAHIRRVEHQDSIIELFNIS